MLLKDDYSHYKFVYFIKEKNEVTEKFKSFLKRMETEERKITRLRTDNGLEFVNKEIQKILSQHGIKHERNVPYTPEQNRAIERENRTIVEAARSMLHAKKMPIKLWAEAVHTAVYVLNRTGTSSVLGKNPYELWHDQTANKLEYKIFGTEAFTHVPKQKRTKWDAKAKKGVFVGYDENTKGYRVYFATENKIEIHRDVKFLPEKTEIAEESEAKKEITLPQELEDPENEEELEESRGKEQEHIEWNRQLNERQKNIVDQEPELQEESSSQEDSQQPKKEERKLRDRAKIRKPLKYRESALEIENLLVAESKQPLTYEEAIQSEESIRIRKHGIKL